MLQDIAMPEKENWAVLVKRLLGSLGFNEVWLPQGVGNFNFKKSKFGQIKTTRSLYSGLEFKTWRFKKSNVLNTYKFVSISTLFKRLEIESGRWHRPMRKPVDERKCKNCNVLENEFHILFECSLHNDLRIQYLDSYFYENPNQFKLKKLFQSTQEKKLI